MSSFQIGDIFYAVNTSYGVTTSESFFVGMVVKIHSSSNFRLFNLYSSNYRSLSRLYNDVENGKGKPEELYNIVQIIKQFPFLKHPSQRYEVQRLIESLECVGSTPSFFTVNSSKFKKLESFTEEALTSIHEEMTAVIKESGGFINNHYVFKREEDLIKQDFVSSLSAIFRLLNFSSFDTLIEPIPWK